jgi:putative oxidoreductase
MAGGASVMRVAMHILRLSIAALLLYAGFVKVADRGAFAGQIDNYRLVEPTTATILAAYIPWLELVLGTALLFRRMYLASLLLATMLMLLFSVALARAWHRGLDIACGCFGSTQITTATGAPLLRNVLILAALVVLMVWDRRHSPTSTPAEAPRTAQSPQPSTS